MRIAPSQNQSLRRMVSFFSWASHWPGRVSWKLMKVDAMEVAMTAVVMSIRLAGSVR